MMLMITDPQLTWHNPKIWPYFGMPLSIRFGMIITQDMAICLEMMGYWMIVELIM